MSVRGSTPGAAPVLQPAKDTPDRMRAEIGISLRIIFCILAVRALT
jgi:hypothetical protein